MASELEPCPFCSKTMMLRSALWPSEGDADAIIHADPTDCPMLGFSDGSADGSIIEKWNCSLSNEDDFPSDGSCVRCGSVPRNANGLCNTCLDEDAERLENTRTPPVAPVSPDTDGKCGELVTVAQAYVNEDGECEEIAWIEGLFPHPECIQLVTRSQAEELLAAERAEKEREIAELRDTSKQMISNWRNRAEKTEADLAEEREKALFLKTAMEIAQTHCGLKDKTIDSLEADNAAQAARIKELEADRDHQSKLSNKLNRSHAALEAKLAAAEKVKEAMRKAAVDYCWQRYKGRDPLSLKNPAVFTSHEWEKIGEAMDAAARAVLGGKPS